MMGKPYRLVNDCPSCGQKDGIGEWRGARMSSSAWGHNWNCCSDACGEAFAKIVREKEQTRNGRRELADRWQAAQEQSEVRFCGEPYFGYNSEQQLKHRRF